MYTAHVLNRTHTMTCAIHVHAGFSHKEVIFLSDATKTWEEKLAMTVCRFVRVGAPRPNETSRGAMVCCIAAKHATMASVSQLSNWMQDWYGHNT